MTTTEDFKSYVKPPRRLFLGLRLSALLEITIAVIALLLFDSVFLDRTNYWNISPSPYLFIVLIIACKYGTKEALFATFITSISLFCWQLPEQTITQDAYEYLFYVLRVPLLNLAAAVVFGELRQMHIFERERLERELNDSQKREHEISAAYEKVKEVKQRLELQVAGQMRSAISVYHAAKTLESLSGIEVMKGIEELVESTLNPEKFSLYSLHKTGLQNTLIHGWEEKDSFLNEFSTDSKIYDAVVNKKSVICVVIPEQEQILSHQGISQGIIAGPLVDRESGEVFGMLKIEKMNFVDLHITNIQTFAAICDWGGLAMINAHKYHLSKSSSIINPDHNLLTEHYFYRYIDYIKALSKRVGFDVTMLQVKLNNPLQFDKEVRIRIAQALSASVQSVLRSVDLAFDSADEEGGYSIVLPTTSLEGAQIVLDKIRRKLSVDLAIIAENANITFTIQNIYDAKNNKPLQ